MVRGPFGPLASIAVWSQFPFCPVFAALPLPLCPSTCLAHLEASALLYDPPPQGSGSKMHSTTQASSLYLYLYSGT